METNIRSLIEGLSYALDAAEKSYFSHSKHVAYISYMVGKELGVDNELLEDIYYAALLHDIGAANAYVIKDHCIFGRDMLLKLPIKKSLSEYVYYHHERYDGSGPFELKSDSIPLVSQIIAFADLFDKNFAETKINNLDNFKNIIMWLENNKIVFNPIIYDPFLKLIEKEHFLLDYFNHEFSNVLKKRVDIIGKKLSYEEVMPFAQIFSEIIDRRSPFTYRHSIGISTLVNRVVSKLGYNSEIQDKMTISALLHDVGKLVISNDIIDKSGKLDDEERFQINKHTYYTRWILEQIDGFEEIVEYASNHHEKLNGKGYPQQLKAEDIGELDHIMTICDIYQALTEDRPYRKTMQIEKVWSIIDNMVQKNELDGNLVAKMKNILE